jgi:inosose dehydratase
MKISRRRFVYAAGSVATLAALPRNALSFHELLYPSRDLTGFGVPVDHNPTKITVGYAAITWGDNLDQAIDDISSLGYDGVQLRANVVKLIPDPSVMASKLMQHRLQFAALSSGDVALDPAEESANLSMHENHARYLQAGGGRLLQVIGTFRKDGKFTDEEYLRTGHLLTEIGKRAGQYGVQLGFHNHMGSIGQSPDHVKKIMDAADPRYVKLLLDVAHYQAGGGDPAAAVHQYADRILFVHFKDVKHLDTPPGYQFVELGEGEVNFPAIIAALKEVQFRGWGIVEFDREPPGSTRTPKESASISKNYIERNLGLIV